MKLVLFVLLLIVLATTAFGQDGRWQDGMVHIRYVEGVDVEAFSGALVAPGSRQALGIAAGAGWSASVAPVDRDRVGLLLRNANEFWGVEIPDPRQQIYVKLPMGVDMEAAVRDLEALPEVEQALRVPIIRLASMGGDKPSDYQDQQTYLNKQYYDGTLNSGIDALWAWNNNVTGQGVTVCDIEYGFYEHCDLPAYDIIHSWPEDTPIGGVIDFSHGTATTGEIAALNDGSGTTGIAYDCNMAFASTLYLDEPDQSLINQPDTAILAVADAIPAGSIMLLEMQIAGPNVTGSGQFGYVPFEWFEPVFNAIQIAVGNGIVVCEAGGNGYQNLDDPIYSQGHLNHWPFLPGPSHDSGAIIVGAGSSGYMGKPQVALNYSNRGSRVNVQGFGNNVVTTLASPDNSCDFYSAEFGFNGTSSATPIVAGAAALIQSEWIVMNQKENQHLNSTQMRRLMESTGTEQNGYDGTNHIGPLPNVRFAIEHLRNPLTYTIHPGSTPYDTIQGAVAGAPPFSTIELVNYTFNENIVFSPGIDLTVKSQSGSGAIIQGDGTASVINMNDMAGATITLQGLEITGGSSETGAGVLFGGGTLSINSCNIHDNHASGEGGAIAITSGEFSMNSVTCKNNSAASGGGIAITGETTNGPMQWLQVSQNTSSDGSMININANANGTSIAKSTICGTGTYPITGPCQLVVSDPLNSITDSCSGVAVPGDMNGDGLLGTDDLMLLHASLDVCHHDVNHDGVTNIDDLLLLIDGWGAICP